MEKDGSNVTNKSTKPHRTGPTVSSSDVETFLAELRHPLKQEIVLLRSIILAAAAGIGESVKWNAPSFSTSDHFATFHLHAMDAVQIVLHLGAKPRPGVKVRGAIADPESLLEWRSGERATVTFRDRRDIEAKRKPFTEIVRQWVQHV